MNTYTTNLNLVYYGKNFNSKGISIPKKVIEKT